MPPRTQPEMLERVVVVSVWLVPASATGAATGGAAAGSVVAPVAAGGFPLGGTALESIAEVPAAAPAAVSEATGGGDIVETSVFVDVLFFVVAAGFETFFCDLVVRVCVAWERSTGAVAG